MAARPGRLNRDRRRRARGSVAVRILGALLLALALPAASTAQAAATPPATPLSNLRTPLPGVFTGGAPKTADGLPAVAALGVRTFVDLRADAETTPEYGAAVAAAGMAYVRVPVAGEGELDLPTARALDALLDDPTRYPLAIVCGSGNRVGALLAVEGFWLDGRPAAEALGLGASAGLTRLEPAVRLLLGLPPLPSPPPAPAPTAAPRS